MPTDDITSAAKAPQPLCKHILIPGDAHCLNCDEQIAFPGVERTRWQRFTAWLAVALKSDAPAITAAQSQTVAFPEEGPVEKWTPECEQALTLMRQALALLDDLVESGKVDQGTCPDLCRSSLDNAIGQLAPSPRPEWTGV
jgi:hypothetical protein